MSFESFKPVLLWSDTLVFLLVLSLLAFFWQLMRNPLSRARWHKVFQSATGMASLAVIVFYVSVALVDSLHFREALPQIEGQSEVHYSQEVRSLLDLALLGMHGNDEKTYSAPFSRYSFAKENMQDENDQVYRDFPLLKHGGQHIATDQEQGFDIFKKSLVGIVLGLLISAAVIAPHWLHRKYRARHSILGSQPLPYWSAYLTLTLLITSSTLALYLSQYYHVLGTNIVGKDVLYQSVKAIRTGVLIGTLATLITMPIAIVLGICAGYFKGWVDDAVQYLYTTLSSIPGILLIAASVLLIDVYIELHPEQFELGAVRADFKFIALCFILGMTSWTGLCRLLRAETLKVSQLDYVQAAHAFAVSHPRIIFKHILPNITHIILIALVLDFSVFVLAEAVLSYIGVGVDPSMASWGNMINDARAELSRDPVVWWPVLAAFSLMFVLVLAANVFSDRVRDAFDPRG